MKKLLALLVVAAIGVAVWWFAMGRGKTSTPSTAVATGSGSGGTGAEGSAAPTSGAQIAVAPSPAVLAAGELETNAQKALAPVIQAAMALPAATRVTQLAKLLDATIAKAASGARDRTWDPATVIAKVGNDRAKLFAWVRDQTVLVPYAGTLRGPIGVMMDRVGNSLDRSLLLAELLVRAGGEARLAHATLDSAAAEQLATAWHKATPPTVPTTPDDPITTANLLAAIGGDQAVLKKQLDAEASARAGVVTKARTQIAAQAGALAKAIAATPASPATDASVLADHWWVQVKDGEAWIDLDATQAEPGKSLAPAAETVARDAVPEPMRHMLAIRVIGEIWHGDTREETTLVEHALAPAEFYGQRLTITTTPLDLPSPEKLDAEKDRPAAVRAALVAQTEWVPMINVGTGPIVRFSVTDAGELYDLMDPNGNTNRLARVVQRVTKTGVGGATGLLEGMPDGTGSDDATTAKPAAGPHSGFTAQWIEIEVRTPNAAPRVIRRTVFDALGAPGDRTAAKPIQLSASAKLDRGLALVGQTEVLAQFARIPDGFVADRLAKYLTTVKPVILAIVQNDGKPLSDAHQATLTGAMPPPDELDSLAIARFALGDADHVYIDQLDVLTAQRRMFAEGGQIRTRNLFDIMTNGVGGWGAPADARTARITQGVADTVAESVLRPCPATGAGCIRGPNTSDAFVSATGWGLVTDPAAPAIAALPIAARAMAAADLANGYALLAPARGSPATWWRVRPETGEVLGQAALGGTSSAEYIALGKGVAIGFGLGFCYINSSGIRMFGCGVAVGIGGAGLFVANQGIITAIAIAAAIIDGLASLPN